MDQTCIFLTTFSVAPPAPLSKCYQNCLSTFGGETYECVDKYNLPIMHSCYAVHAKNA
jgi:hypothetical protein